MTNKKRALIVTTVASTIDQFCMHDIELLSEMDYKIDVAANFYDGNNTSRERVAQFQNELIENGYNVNNIDFSRSPFSVSNIRAYKKLSRLISKNSYDIIHCHTPIASVFTRLAARKARRKGTRVIYTAHGFHFFSGAPMINWLLYYPIEKVCAKYTDLLITINKEDFQRASKVFDGTKIEYIPGVGIDVDTIRNIQVSFDSKRSELGVPHDCFLITSVGQLNDNKNHKTIIKALDQLKNDNVFYCICGKGEKEKELRHLCSKLGVSDKVIFTGYRRDIIEILKVSNVFAFPSKREGLAVAALEAMAAGLPIVTSNVRGIVDYSVNNQTGYTCDPTDIDAFSEAFSKLYADPVVAKSIGNYNKNAVRRFDKSNTISQMKRIYKASYEVKNVSSTSDNCNPSIQR